MKDFIYDGPLDIAIGRNREETRWQNKEWKWSDLVNRVSNTHRTAEIYADYMKAKPARQDNIKDVGGFVGGIINGGRRRNGSIVHRQLLTLDIDFATSAPELWEDITLLGMAATMYSTHKHSPVAPRLRLLLPIDRPVDIEQYEAIGRKVASWFNIELFDPTTFQPTRLMYWPSTSKDGEYVFQYQDGPWLCADEVLNQYEDWRDSSQWPVSAKAKEKINNSIEKQGDPRLKSGLVGAFCRTHDIQSAIATYLPDVYQGPSDDGRYTWSAGSTANGLVLYEDGTFAYSHHSTDPISEKLCNAFDLVRIHRFAHLDEKVTKESAGLKLPSFVAMSELAANDKAVRRTIGSEKLQEAQEAFADQPEITEADVEGMTKAEKEALLEGWMEELEVDVSGHYASTINNVILVLENDPGLKGKFGYDSFEHRETLIGDLPWRKVPKIDPYMKDTDEASLRHYLELIYGLTAERKIADALSIVQQRHAVHPIRHWLDGLVWDGTPRAERIFIDYLGANATEYIKTVTRKALLACVTRIYEPGTKFDEITTIVGKQGIGKSTILFKLGTPWFSDSLTDLNKKDSLEQLQGAWIFEMGELESMRRAELSSFKHFVAKREDRFRVSYGKRVQKFPRQCVFFATIDEWDFLKDEERRFWPVTTNQEAAWKSVFDDFTPDVVAQVWAEVMGWYLMGEQLFLEPKIRDQAKEVRTEHVIVDDRLGALGSYLDKLLPASWEEKTIYERRAWLQSGEEDMAESGSIKRYRVSVAEIWCELMGGQMRELTTYNSRDVNQMMKRMKGWKLGTKTSRRGASYGTQRVWERESLDGMQTESEL